MYFLLIGIVGVVLKFFESTPVAALSWWIVLTPFGMTILWWAWADASGYTKRVEIKKMDKRKQDRIDKQRQTIGTLSKKLK